MIFKKIKDLKQCKNILNKLNSINVKKFFKMKYYQNMNEDLQLKYYEIILKNLSK